MEKPIIIELAGVSCCGKSTAFSQLFNMPRVSNVLSAEQVLKEHYIAIAKQLLFIDLTTPSPLFKVSVLLWVHLKNITRYPKFYGLCLYAVALGSERIKAFKSFYFKTGKCLLLRQIKKDVIIVDEGIIQLLFSLFVRSHMYSENTDAILNKIIKHAPLPDEVIFGPVEPLNLIIARMINRGHHRVTNGRYTVDELESRARVFTVQSIDLQLDIIERLNGKLIINRISDVSMWDVTFKRLTQADRVQRLNTDNSVSSVY